MASLTGRLDKLTSSLSAKEKAVLVLKAINAGQEPDPQLCVNEDPVQGQIYNRYVGLIYLANVELDAMYQSISYAADRLQQDTTVGLLREAAGLVQEQTGEKVDQAVVRRWRKCKTITSPEFFYGVAEEVRQWVLADVLARCREMAAVDVVSQELTTDFEGEDLRRPELRAQVDATWETLRELVLRLGGPKRLPGPDDAVVELMRQRIDTACTYLKLIEIVR